MKSLRARLFLAISLVTLFVLRVTADRLARKEREAV